MTLPLVTAAVTLFYLSAIPIHIALRLSADGFGVGISAFEPRFARRHALQPRKSGGTLPKSLSPRDILEIVKKLKIDSIVLRGVFGCDDAAVTALVCGGISSLAGALRGILGPNVRISVQPDFSANGMRAELTGMISIRAGHIMLAALHGAYQIGSRRFKQWTSIPLKAS